MKGVKVNVYAPSRMIRVQNQIRPNFSFDVDGVNAYVTFENSQSNGALLVKANFSLNHIKVLETSRQTKKANPRPGRPPSRSPARGPSRAVMGDGRISTFNASAAGSESRPASSGIGANERRNMHGGGPARVGMN